MDRETHDDSTLAFLTRIDERDAGSLEREFAEPGMNIEGKLTSQPLDEGEPISLLDSPGHLALGDAATLTLPS